MNIGVLAAEIASAPATKSGPIQRGDRREAPTRAERRARSVTSIGTRA